MIAIEKNIGSTHISLWYVCFYTPHPQISNPRRSYKETICPESSAFVSLLSLVNPIGHGLKKVPVTGMLQHDCEQAATARTEDPHSAMFE